MIRSFVIFSIFSLIVLTLVQAEDAVPIHLALSIPLPGVEGRIDHLAFDPSQQRLFIAALGNDTLEVADLKTKTVRSLKGFSEPQGVVFIPELKQVFVTNGGDGSGMFLNATSLEVVRRVNVGSDADNVCLDALGKRLFVGYSSNLAVLDFQGARVLDIKLAAHPEGLELEHAKNGAVSRVFVNVPGAGHVAVVDLEKRAVVATWGLPAASNFPMALDEPHHRLLVATRSSARLVVLETNTGKVMANLETVGDPDDVFVAATGRRVFVSGGAGEVRVLERHEPNQYVETARVPTAAGARTSLLEATGKRLFVAAPHRGNQTAEIQVFEITP